MNCETVNDLLKNIRPKCPGSDICIVYKYGEENILRVTSGPKNVIDQYKSSPDIVIIWRKDNVDPTFSQVVVSTLKNHGFTVYIH